MRKTVIAANWKMNGSHKALEDYITKLNPNPDILTELLEVILAVPFVFLDQARQLCAETPIRLAAQNVHWESSGAFTGEVSAPMLKELGASHVIIGHSERRKYFCEDDANTALKVMACEKNNLTPILCVGESLEERNSGKLETTLDRQLGVAIAKLQKPENLVVAYEPVWAIGTGVSASAAQAQKVHAYLRKSLREKYGDRAHSIPIIYGGSVNLSNFKEFISQVDVDGVLVGKASLDPLALGEMLRISSR